MLVLGQQEVVAAAEVTLRPAEVPSRVEIAANSQRAFASPTTVSRD
jgi:hypothetical protein